MVGRTGCHLDHPGTKDCLWRPQAWRLLDGNAASESQSYCLQLGRNSVHVGMDPHVNCHVDSIRKLVIWWRGFFVILQCNQVSDMVGAKFLLTGTEILYC